MPSELKGRLRFPVAYEPWFVYDATLEAAVSSFEFMDILTAGATSGKFDRNKTPGDINLITGYVIALEPYKSGVTSIQVAVPGSTIPAVAVVSITPQSLVKLTVVTTTFKQRIAVANAADLAAGDVLGRMRSHFDDHSNLRTTIADDVVLIATGVI